MPYSYLEHEADVGLEGTGETIEEAIESGIQGLLDLMVDTETIRPADSISVRAEASEPATLFVALLNAVLAERDISGWFFRGFRIDSLEEKDGHWWVEGILCGEPIDLSRHSIGNEVKAATYSGLRFINRPDFKSFRCVLDI